MKNSHSSSPLRRRRSSPRRISDNLPLFTLPSPPSIKKKQKTKKRRKNLKNKKLVDMWLYVSDLDTSVTALQLYDFCKNQTEVISVRIERDLTTGQSLGYGYIYYANRENALRALEVLNFTPLNGTPIREMCESGPGNIFIKNLDKAIDRQALHDTFSSFGNILSCRVATDPSGQSKGYGFVQYDSEEAAQKAIETLNGMLLNDKQVYVGPFLQKQEREMALDKVKFTNVFIKNLSESTTEEDLKKIFGDFGAITSAVLMGDADGNSQTVKEAADKSQGLNLYFKNLDDSIGDDKLKELFSRFGIITSYKVMRDPSGVSRGSGFVAFSTPEEASRALLEMNGKMIVSKPLYVAHAQRKEDRRAILQAQFCPVVMAPLVAPRMPMYPPGGPGLGQQIFYGQAPPAIIPPRPDFGYQQQLVPGMRPGGGPIPNFFVPMVQQGQRPGGRRAGGVPGQQGQQPVPLMQQQCFRGGGSTASPQDVACLVLLEACFPSLMIWVACLCMMGECLNQFQLVLWLLPLQMLLLLTRGRMLGENLYPLVEQLEPEKAAKVTGMLLEMDGFAFAGVA
ncbi:unnamed protein product [Camellia sinensis]